MTCVLSRQPLFELAGRLDDVHNGATLATRRGAVNPRFCKLTTGIADTRNSCPNNAQELEGSM
jgi:hypothetical protein